MASAPNPPSIRSSRRESAHTSSLARERRKGKEVIRLTPDATSGYGHRQAPVRRWHRRQGPHQPVSADLSRLILHPCPPSEGKENMYSGSRRILQAGIYTYRTHFRAGIGAKSPIDP